MIFNYHIRLARSALNITQAELAEKSGVSAPTIKNIESSSPDTEFKNNKTIMMALLRFFEDSGIKFIDEDDFIGIKIEKKVVKKSFK